MVRPGHIILTPDPRLLFRASAGRSACLSAVSSITSRVRLATVVLQAALRRPVVLAKTVATLDTLSNGRVDLGVGVRQGNL